MSASAPKDQHVVETEPLLEDGHGHEPAKNWYDYSLIFGLPSLVMVACILIYLYPVEHEPIPDHENRPLKDCTAAAGGFFANVRTPASLLTGAALGALWIDFGVHISQCMATMTYVFLIATAVALEFSCIFMSTAAGVHILRGHMNPMAPDTLTFLVREMEFEYLATRLQFFSGLLLFLTGLATRAWVKLPKNMARAVALVWTGTACSMIAFFNTTSAPYNGYVGMLMRCGQLFFQKFGSSPLGIIAIVLNVGGGLFIVRIVQRGPHVVQAHNELHHHK